MSMVSMNRVTNEVLLDLVAGENVTVKIPESVTVLSFVQGDIDNGTRGIMHWARLEVTPTDEFVLLKKVNLQENATILKLKLSNYLNENLDNLVGSVITTSNLDIVFDEKKVRDRSTVVGVSFKSDLKNLEIVKGEYI